MNTSLVVDGDDVDEDGAGGGADEKKKPNLEGEHTAPPNSASPNKIAPENLNSRAAYDQQRERERYNFTPADSATPLGSGVSGSPSPNMAQVDLRKEIVVQVPPRPRA